MLPGAEEQDEGRCGPAGHAGERGGVITRLAGAPFPDDVRRFVDSTRWTFAKTYADTWPHEYVVRTDENAGMILAIARHIFEHGTDGRFYSQVRKYHHENGKVYWSMASTPEEATLINRCDEHQTYESRLAAGTLPGARRPAR